MHWPQKLIKKACDCLQYVSQALELEIQVTNESIVSNQQKTTVLSFLVRVQYFVMRSLSISFVSQNRLRTFPLSIFFLAVTPARQHICINLLKTTVYESSYWFIYWNRFLHPGFSCSDCSSWKSGSIKIHKNSWQHSFDQFILLQVSRQAHLKKKKVSLSWPAPTAAN